MPHYPKERKDAVLSKLLPPHNRPVPEIAKAEGISEATLYNWLKQARQQGVPVPGSISNSPEDWSGEAKFAVVLETAPLNAGELSEYCRAKGLYPEQVSRWRQACIEGAASQEAPRAGGRRPTESRQTANPHPGKRLRARLDFSRKLKWDPSDFSSEK